MSYTLDEFMKLNKGYTKSYDPKTQMASVGNKKTGKSISFKYGQGQDYGLGAVENGSHSIADINKFTSALNNKYESPYSKDITSTLSKLQNKKFSYDPTQDQGLQSAQGSAMDAVSRAAARRGMLYSDSNKSQMGKSALELVPQFRQQALSEYNMENSNLYNKLNTLQGLENNAYGKYRDELSDQAASSQNQFNQDVTLANLLGQYQGQPTLAGQQQTMAQDQQNFNNQVTQADLTGLYNGEPTMAMKNMTFNQAQQEIQNAISRGNLNVAQGSLALRQAQQIAENDPESLDNRMKATQLERMQLENQQLTNPSQPNLDFGTALDMTRDRAEQVDINGKAVNNKFSNIEYVLNLPVSEEEKEDILKSIGITEKDLDDFASRDANNRKGLYPNIYEALMGR